MMLAPNFKAILITFWFLKNLDKDKYIYIKLSIKVINNLEQPVDS